MSDAALTDSTAPMVSVGREGKGREGMKWLV